MDSACTSAILRSVVALTVGVAVLFRQPHHALHRSFSLFSSVVLLWELGFIAIRFDQSVFNTPNELRLS